MKSIQSQEDGLRQCLREEYDALQQLTLSIESKANVNETVDRFFQAQHKTDVATFELSQSVRAEKDENEFD